MFNNEEADCFENAIRQVLKERKKELNFTDAQIGELAFKNSAKFPLSKVQDFMHRDTIKSSRKPQNMRLSDVLNVCEALRLSWYDVIENARKKIKEKT